MNTATPRGAGSLEGVAISPSKMHLTLASAIKPSADAIHLVARPVQLTPAFALALVKRATSRSPNGRPHRSRVAGAERRYAKDPSITLVSRTRLHLSTAAK
jgi:hypothetical protein